MLHDILIRSFSLATSLVLALFGAPASSVEVAATEQDRSPDALQARLDEAESNYKNGKVNVAIEQATSLVDVTDSSVFKSDRVARDARADLAVFQLKAGHPELSAMQISNLLMNLQLELPADPRFFTDTAAVLAESPQILKDYFDGVIKRLDEKGDVKPIIDSLINNTVPKNYLAQLKAYSVRMKATDDQLHDLQSIADSEELKYGDSITSLDEAASGNDAAAQVSAAKLDKLDKALDALATEAQNMPVADMRAALGLYKLALVANSVKLYPQAETFAQQSLAHVERLMKTSPLLPQIRVALAYALLKRGKSQEFKAVRDAVLKGYDDRERLLIALARFTELSGDDAGAASIYKRALDNRTKQGTTQPPEWADSYNTLLKKVGTN